MKAYVIISYDEIGKIRSQTVIGPKNKKEAKHYFNTIKNNGEVLLKTVQINITAQQFMKLH